MTFGPLVKHFTYDGLGRLIRTQSPLPDPQTAAALNIPLPLRSERHYYDGVRRLATLVVDPLIPIAALPGGEPELDPEGLSLGQEMQQAGDPVGEGDPIEPNPIPTPVPSVLAREYVWGPGDGPAGVDELLAQFDEQHQPIWILQDASGDVVAAADLGAPAVRPPGVPETVPADAFTARLVWLGSHEAYGGIVAARTIHPHAPIHAGHKGLFVERLDAGVIDGLPGLPGIGGGTGRVETPRLAPNAALLAHARNRWLHAGLGMWTSNDPNASGQITVARALHHGGSWGQPLASYSLEAAYGDGPNLFAAYRATPMGGGDPLGLYMSPLDTLQVGAEIASMLSEQIELYARNQMAALEWAEDWTLSDGMLDRSSGSGDFDSDVEDSGLPGHPGGVSADRASSTVRLAKILAGRGLKLGQVFPSYAQAKAAKAGLKLGSKVQAHHIVPKAIAEKLNLNTNGPAVFLTKLEHQILTKRLNALNASLRTHRMSPEKARKEILKIYKDFPEWHCAVDDVFGM